MQSPHPYMQTISAHVAAFQKPEVVSLSEDTHVFHFERDGNWQEGDLLLVNRNGHHFRLLRKDDSRWLFCKTWNGLFDYHDWMADAGLRREKPEDLMDLCGVGPQGKQSFEGLCLLPKGTTSGRRRAAWRNHILEVRFDIDNDRFTLVAAMDETGVSPMKVFSGKPWESQEAGRWCLANLSRVVTQASTPVHEPVDAIVEAELEGSALWGIF